MDVYACGLIYWEILTWAEAGYPYHNLSEHQLYEAVRDKEERPPLDRLKKYPGSLIALIQEMWRKDPKKVKKKTPPITFQRLKKFGYCYRRLTHRLHAGHSIIASIYVVCCRPSRRVPGINSVLELLYTFVHFDPFQEENKNSLSPIYQHQATGLKFMHNVSLLGVLLSNSSFHKCSNWRSRAVGCSRPCTYLDRSTLAQNFRLSLHCRRHTYTPKE